MKAQRIEKLAEIEHDQWAHWTEYMLDNLTKENIERWREQIKTPYSELTEREKDSDRFWANKADKVCCGDLLDRAVRTLTVIAENGELEDNHCRAQVCLDVINQQTTQGG